ncbi:MAG: hypothetical protein ACM3VT_06455 [Solirubrobacterales bacterium]
MSRLLSMETACLLLAALSIFSTSTYAASTFTTEVFAGSNWTMITSGTLPNGTPYSVDTGLAGPPTFEGEFQTGADYGAPLPAGFVGLVGCGVGNRGTLDYTSMALNGVDLSGVGTFGLILSNDDDDPWQYRLFADSGGTTVLGPWTAISPNGGQQSLSLDVSGLTGTGQVGFQIGSSLREDCFHTSVATAVTPAAIPAPGALLLCGIGGLLVHRFRFRTRL